MIYILSHSRGAFWYLDSSNFANPVKHADTLSKIGTEYSRSDEEFIQAFNVKYSDSLPPSWMMLEVPHLVYCQACIVTLFRAGINAILQISLV
jgi:hypothetical protein